MNWVNYNGKKKKLFGIHTNGNYIIKITSPLIKKEIQITKY